MGKCTAILPPSMDYVQYSHREAGRLLEIDGAMLELSAIL